MTNPRKQVAQRKRRIIMNNDGGDGNKVVRGELKTAEAFLRDRTTALAGTHVDAIFYCTGEFNHYTHDSQVTDIYRDPAGDTSWLERFKAAEGCDLLEIMIDFAHAHDMELFWSMRMNDIHDGHPDEHMNIPWKQRHPECLMGKRFEKFPCCDDRAAAAVNYELPAVRDQVFAILQDVCRRYDLDGVELDFFRHPLYFRNPLLGQPVTQSQCDLLTDLLRRIRTLTEEVAAQRGRPLLIAARVPDSVGYARGLGLDLPAWLQNDLVDLLVGSCYFHLEPWENFVALTRPYGVPAYACLSGSRLCDPVYPEEPVPLEVMRGEALRAWDAGLSGIYTFNRFVPADPIFGELGDPALLRTLPRTYRFNPGPLELMNAYLPGGEAFLVPEK